MSAQAAFMSKLKELKLKMAELENMEDQLPEGEQKLAEASESPEMQEMEESMGIEKHEEPAEGSELSDDDLMEAFGKKKKMPAKPGMKIAIAVGKSKGKPLFGKK